MSASISINVPACSRPRGIQNYANSPRCCARSASACAIFVPAAVRRDPAREAGADADGRALLSSIEEEGQPWARP